MGLFDKIESIMKIADKVVNSVEDIAEVKRKITSDEGLGQSVGSQSTSSMDDVVIADSFHTVQDAVYGDDDSEYIASFQLNDSFKSAQSHAGEIEMLNTYAPMDEYGEEGVCPYVAVQLDDKVYCAVEEFKEKGTFTGGTEITPLSGKFYFKAKMEYFEDMMYFYGMDRCDGFWENNGLCMVYPKVYVGTDNEKKLMKVLDEAAQSYNETRK